MSAMFVNKDGQEVSRTRCAIYTRVMGYHRPVDSFNIGKKSEFFSRKYFKNELSNKQFIEEFSC